MTSVLSANSVAASRYQRDMERLWDILRNEAVGHEAAIGAEALAARLDLSERRVRAMVHDLVATHHRPIGSSVGAGRFGRPGYYLVVTAEERRAARNQLIGRLRALVARLRAFDAVTAHQLARQLELDFGEEDGERH